MAHAGRRTDVSKWRSIMGKLQHRINVELEAEKKAAQGKKKKEVN